MATYAAERENTLSLNTRRIVVAGILGAIAILLAVTRIGFIPVPNTTGNATIMHVPAILGGVLEGPVVGFLVGGIFGVFSFIQAEVPAFKDPLVAILPRLFIGIVAWLVFVGTMRATRNLYVAAIVAGLLGTLTNTVGVLGMGTIRGYFPPELIVTILPQVIAELVLAAVITVIVVKAMDLYRSGRTTAPEVAGERRY
ncbi:MAG TPA: ECF transporter S component [Candidatus Limnocylindria bacterium]|nr:ECF transporter S component [Candidatus Limnocylindria bacterium]